MRTRISLAACVAVMAAIGCTAETQTTPTPATSVSSAEGIKFLLSEPPKGEEDVISLRNAAKDGDDVVIVGRIGGSENPWVEGRAAFSIVDRSLKSCAECGSDDCPKPWDYC